MTVLAFTSPSPPVGPDLAAQLATATGLSITNATVTGPTARGGLLPNTCYITGTISEANRVAIQTALNAYVYDPTFGRKLLPFVVTMNGGLPITWTNMPAAVTGAQGTQTKIPMYNVAFARLTAHVITQGAASAVLIAQVSLDASAWSSGPQVPINTTGLQVSSLTVVPAQFQTDCFVRIAGSGGDGAIDPQFGLVTVQFA